MVNMSGVIQPGLDSTIAWGAWDIQELGLDCIMVGLHHGRVWTKAIHKVVAIDT